jgi:hypothetical protein
MDLPLPAGEVDVSQRASGGGPGIEPNASALTRAKARPLPKERRKSKSFAYLKFSLAKSQLTRFHHASTYLGRALR